MSDPSANFETFLNSCWATKMEVKARSESDSLDRFSAPPGGLCEVEAGDLSDGEFAVDYLFVTTLILSSFLLCNPS